MQATIERVTRSAAVEVYEATGNQWGGVDYQRPDGREVRLVDDYGDTVLHVFGSRPAMLLEYTVRFQSGTPDSVIAATVHEALR